MDALPSELLCLVFGELSWGERLELAGVCRRWRRLLLRQLRSERRLGLDGIGCVASSRRGYLRPLLRGASAGLTALSLSNLELDTAATAFRGLHCPLLQELSFNSCRLHHKAFAVVLEAFLGPSSCLHTFSWTGNRVVPAPEPSSRMRKQGTAGVSTSPRCVEEPPTPADQLLAAALPPSLRRLALDGLALTPGALDTLADRLPQLRRLRLSEAPSRLRRRHLESAVERLSCLELLDLGPDSPKSLARRILASEIQINCTVHVQNWLPWMGADCPSI